MAETESVRRYRAIWISDVHLGTKASKAEYLLDFLRRTDCETLYLVGDIFDGWRLKRHWYWPQAHNDVVQKLLRKARKGTRVIYLPGNHDEGVRQFVGLTFGGVEVMEDCIHETADGRRLLVIHGDQFDVVVRYARWLAHLGDTAYVMLLGTNTWVNAVRRRTGRNYWSLSAFLKHKVKSAVEFIGRFEAVLTEEARRREVDGVVCGHVHTASMKDMDGVTYINDGDWVESCTALVEDLSGALRIVRWTDEMAAHGPVAVPAETESDLAAA